MKKLEATLNTLKEIRNETDDMQIYDPNNLNVINEVKNDIYGEESDNSPIFYDKRNIHISKENVESYDEPLIRNYASTNLNAIAATNSKTNVIEPIKKNSPEKNVSLKDVQSTNYNISNTSRIGESIPNNSNMPINSTISENHNKSPMYKNSISNNHDNYIKVSQPYTEEITRSFGDFGVNTINSTDQFQPPNHEKPMYKTHYIDPINTTDNEGRKINKVVVHRLPDIIVDPTDPTKISYRNDTSVSPTNNNSNPYQNNFIHRDSNNSSLSREKNRIRSDNIGKSPRQVYRVKKLPDVIFDKDDPSKNLYRIDDSRLQDKSISINNKGTNKLIYKPLIMNI